MDHYQEELLHAFSDASNRDRFQFLKNLFEVTPNRELPRIAKLVHNATRRRCKKVGVSRKRLQGTGNLNSRKNYSTIDQPVTDLQIPKEIQPVSISNEFLPVPTPHEVVPVPSSNEVVPVPFQNEDKSLSNGIDETDDDKELDACAEGNGWYDKYPPSNIIAIDCEKVDMFLPNERKTKRKFELKAGEVGVCDLYGNTIYHSLIYRKKGTFRQNPHAKNGFKTHSLEVKEAKPIGKVKEELRKIFEGKLILGVDMAEDFSSLDLDFGNFSVNCFDLQWHYKDDFFSSKGKTIRERWSLKRMCRDLLGQKIQNDECHSAIDDAASTAKVFKDAYMNIQPKPAVRVDYS